MQEQEKKDIIVVAREGYSVLLEIDGRMFDIDCHEVINLSEMFPIDVLEKCSSLSIHLKDGNLVLFEPGIELSEDTVSIEIKPLREETAEHITSQYDQVEKDVNRTNMELETRANITEDTRKHIQAQVQASKEKILQSNEKLLANAIETIRTTNEVANSPKERQNAMTPEELAMKVSMDISPETFAEKQVALGAKFAATVEADEERAEKEIAQQDVDE
ncbi:hypothetical protein KA005_64695 [bacterium]|nr:hypothetical protein [bacterium]